MDYRILLRFVGEYENLSLLRNSFIDKFPEAELPEENSNEWYSVSELVLEEYECKFEELPESELLAMDGSLMIENEIPENIFDEILVNFPKVFCVFKWSSMEVGISCGVSDGWGEFNPNYMDNYSDEANEISEAVLGF